MTLITNIITAIAISSMLYTSCPQYLLINTEIQAKNEIQVVEKSINKDLKYLKEDIKMPQFKGGNDEKNIDIINNKISSDILPKAEETEKIAKEYFSTPSQNVPRFPYEIESNFSISKDSNQIISLFNNYYQYSGGAHGITIRTSYTIDKNKEILLPLKDLFIKDYDYKENINKEITKIINKNPENYFDNGSIFKGISDEQGFYIKDDNLIIYYQQYDIAPYVFGIPEFKIPLSYFENNYIYKEK